MAARRLIVFASLLMLLAIMTASHAADATFDLSADKPGTLRFYGSETADLFTREIVASYAGVLRKNYIAKGDGTFLPGFVHASPPGQGWAGTFWTRDGGTFMRELVLWGNYEHARQSADCLMKMVAKNDEGFYSFPEYFSPGDKKSGKELDGTSSIVIGVVLLWQRLPDADPFKLQIYHFLHDASSPARYIQHQLKAGPLVAGSGEFGGGCGIGGEFYNVVQNNLAMLALTAAANMETEAGDARSAASYRRDAQKIRDNMLKYLVDADGSWIWCIDTKTLKPIPEIINHEINKGFGGLNGPGCMYSDALGLEPLDCKWKGVEHSRKTLEKLYSFPARKEQFDKYGIWSQFDVYRAGTSSSPSYGDGYALQTMLLYDMMDMADKSVAWMATSTCKPVAGYHIDRDSPYYFYERNYSPDAVGKTPLEQGCGALNLVNATEPIKAARLILGVDDTSASEVKIIPRIPPSWKGVEAMNWPIRTSKGVVRATIRCERTCTGNHFRITLQAGQSVPHLAVRLNGKWFHNQDVSALELP